MKLPTREECLHMLREHNPENIVRHSLVVNRIANYLAKKLKERGEKIDLELVDRASLLHDIAKFITLDSDVWHGERGYEILIGKGYPEIALITKEHALNEILKEGSLKTLENRVVHYADKRVNHDRIVSLMERFDYLRRVYGSKSREIMDTINKCEKPTILLEEEIFKKAGVDKKLGELK